MRVRFLHALLWIGNDMHIIHIEQDMHYAVVCSETNEIQIRFPTRGQAEDYIDRASFSWEDWGKDKEDNQYDE